MTLFVRNFAAKINNTLQSLFTILSSHTIHNAHIIHNVVIPAPSPVPQTPQWHTEYSS